MLVAWGCSCSGLQDSPRIFSRGGDISSFHLSEQKQRGMRPELLFPHESWVAMFERARLASGQNEFVLQGDCAELGALLDRGLRHRDPKLTPWEPSD